MDMIPWVTGADHFWSDVSRYRKGGAWGTKTGRRLKKSSRVVGKGISGTYNFAVNHPVPLVVGAAAAGLYADHPLGKFENAMTGDPHYLGKIGALPIAPAFGYVGPQPGMRASIYSPETVSYNYSANPDPDQNLRASEANASYPNPSGALVFGLYNNRLR